MMSGRPLAVLVIVIAIAVLWFAVKFGTIGGGGAGADRDKDPFNYWLGVSITAAMLYLMTLVLIGTSCNRNTFGSADGG